jgi:hypothetical protein
MLKLVIENRAFTVHHFWKDITLREFIEVSKVPIPEKVKNLYLASKGNDKEYSLLYSSLDDSEFFNYYIEVITRISNVPKKILKNTETDIILNFFDIYLKHIVFTMIFNTPVDFIEGNYVAYVPDMIESVKINGEDYLFPRSMKVNGEQVLMVDEQILSFVEACDLDLTINSLLDGKANGLALFMSIYCRRFGEVYNQKTVLERVDMFKELTMDKVWSLFFCTGVPSKRFLCSSALSSRIPGRKTVQR